MEDKKEGILLDYLEYYTQDELEYDKHELYVQLKDKVENLNVDDDIEYIYVHAVFCDQNIKSMLDKKIYNIFSHDNMIKIRDEIHNKYEIEQEKLFIILIIDTNRVKTSTELSTFNYITDLSVKNKYVKKLKYVLFKLNSSEKISQLKSEVDFSNITFYGPKNVANCIISINSFADSYIEFDQRLFHLNVRNNLDNSKLQKNLIGTIFNDPSDFYLYHNGIAISAASIDVSVTSNSIIVNDYSVVNGAQTISTVGYVKNIFVMTKKFCEFDNDSDLCEKSKNGLNKLKLDNIIKFNIDENQFTLFDLLEKLIHSDVESKKVLNNISKFYSEFVEYFNKAKKIIDNNKKNDNDITIQELYTSCELINALGDIFISHLKVSEVNCKILHNTYNVIHHREYKKLTENLSYNANNQLSVTDNQKYSNHDFVYEFNRKAQQYNISINKEGSNNIKGKNLKIGELFKIILSTYLNTPGTGRTISSNAVISKFLPDNLDQTGYVREIDLENDTAEYEGQEYIIADRLFEIVNLQIKIDKITKAYIKENAYIHDELNIYKYGNRHILNFIVNKNIDAINLKDIDVEDNVTNAVTSLLEKKADIEKLLEIESLLDTNSFKRDFHYDLNSNSWIK